MTQPLHDPELIHNSQTPSNLQQLNPSNAEDSTIFLQPNLIDEAKKERRLPKELKEIKSSKKFERMHFKISNGEIKLNACQKINLKNSLQVVFPDIYTDTYILHRYNIDVSSDLKAILELLGTYMSNRKLNYFIENEHMDFLNQLWSKYITLSHPQKAT